ncbi:MULTISPECIES: ABC transporter ATP-binding protein [unclassified Peribacillus]|uniref:ABC transporter ATP-binding protein n=1 Tax=unclassified Peribacillus TaxID=2675266 RepID=UPI0019132203|nr:MULTISPECIES: ABC transporter ATP-binding protein [unclassified Peribacillus]MBK5460747.1 ABC transporter ATP-binding protein [Peribacillus sp. TH27]MBK5498891.1 ABC transporter ATP-binding protein [Peribacillus sp. TH14]WMX56003.1 ABC transporter ATP-binding protein [Peribacillus sp. R9-11]
MSNILEAISMNKKVELGKDNELHILKDVNLDIEEGEFVSVMGPSGSGKSTLLYNVSGMDRITSGSVKFKDCEIGTLKEEELAKIRLNHMGFIFQDINLLKNLSLIDNVMFPALVSKDADKNTVYQKAKKLMEMTGIEKLADNTITQGSGGQLQRVAICRALINDPDIIFGDEPTGALDSKSSADIMSILAEINNEGTTIMLVTHDAKVAAKTERILFMVDGNLVAQKKMSKYDNQHDDIKKREESIMKWLVENGF